MDCPSCGLGLSGVTLARCPRCGQPILTPDTPPAAPSQPSPSAPRTAPLLPPLTTVEPRLRGRRKLLVGALACVAALMVVVSCGALYLTSVSNRPAELKPLAGVTATLQGKLTYENTFLNEVDSWAEGENCHVRVDGYHVMNGYVCFAPLQKVFDVDVYVQVKQVSGSDTPFFGIVFRGYDNANFYAMGVNGNGDWGAFVCVNSSCNRLAGYERNAAVLKGAGATNALEALVSGTHFTFIINGVKVGEADDNSVGNGIVGLYAGPNVEASFTNLMIAQPANGGSYS